MEFRAHSIRRATALALALSMSATLPLPACSAVAAAVPLVTALVSQALTVLVGIDAVVQEHFRRHPDVPLPDREAYTSIFEKTMRSLRALQHAADGAKDLDDGEVERAFAEFEAAYNELRGWLFDSRIMDGSGQLLLDGKVVSSEPVPDAQALMSAP